ncbi:hypothetical protein B0H13DRAFT_2319137 [Mycena leptocephala]|nr:hypothetical protein B0H13DRAFT_2319137 [Mycena leptocephala]
MLTFIPTIIVLLVSATSASALSLTDQQEKCIVGTCTPNATKTAGCAADDIACACASSVFVSAVTSCIVATCGVSSSDAQDALAHDCPNAPATGSSDSNSPASSGKPNSADFSGCHMGWATSAVVGSSLPRPSDLS